MTEALLWTVIVAIFGLSLYIFKIERENSVLKKENRSLWQSLAGTQSRIPVNLPAELSVPIPERQHKNLMPITRPRTWDEQQRALELQHRKKAQEIEDELKRRRESKPVA